jgi:hypothetical protein
MKLIWSIALALAMLIQPTGSRAEEFSYAGIGAISCGEIAKGYRQNPTQIENMMVTWAQGFMSGQNLSPGSTQYRDLAAMSLDAQKESLRNYCDEHPMAELVKGVIDLYLKLPLKKYPPPASR